MTSATTNPSPAVPAELLGKRTSRLAEVDRAKGVAMLLVVVGHMSRPTLFHGQTVWPGLEWYGLLHDWIYLFHMPFFMFATGFLLFRTYKPPSDVGQYLGLVGRRVHRILPGYFIYGLAALAGKLLLSHTNVATVEGTPSSAWSGFVDLLTCPVDGPATQLWYLYVLLIYSIFLPAVFKAVGRGLAILLPIALVLHFVPAGKFLAADQVCEYLFVLILGCLAAKHYDVFRRWAGKLALLWLAIFVAAFFVLPTDDDNYRVSKLVLGVLSIPAIWGLVLTPSSDLWGVLQTIGRYTFIIYLLHAPVLAAIRIGLTKAGHFGGGWFMVAMPAMVALAVMIPILLKKKFFSRYQWVDQITG